MKHKIIKMHLGTWRRLRSLFPAVKDETADQYFRRIAIILDRMKSNETNKFPIEEVEK